MLERPYAGLVFDVEHAGLWWPESGDRRGEARDRADILRKVVDDAPRLVPLVGHRYIPAAPSEPGNPVFSIHQSDILYYGANLADYIERAFGNRRGPVGQPTIRVRFWCDLVDRAYQAPFYRGNAGAQRYSIRALRVRLGAMAINTLGLVGAGGA